MVFLNTVGVFFLLLAIWAALGPKNPILAGFCLGALYLSRSGMILALPFFLIMFSDRWLHWDEHRPLLKRVDLTPLVQLGSGIAVFMLAGFVYNYLRFENPFDSGYFHSEQYKQVETAHVYNHGPFHLSYIDRHIPPTFELMPRFQEAAPYVLPSYLGTAIWVTTPAFLLTFFAALRDRRVIIAGAIALALSAAYLIWRALGFLWDANWDTFDTPNVLPGPAWGLHLLPFYAMVVIAVASGVRQAVLTRGKDRLVIASWSAVADIDYQTIITYTGGYDDMVMAKTQIRSTIESENAQREKKIAQLNEFIQRFGAGTRASQVTSRRKEVERLQTTELARSNIQRPYIKFAMKRPSGKVALEFKGLKKAFGGLKVIPGFDAIVNRGEKIVLVGRNGAGKTTMLKALLSDAPGMPASPSDVDAGKITWGHEVSIGYFPQDQTGSIQKGLTAADWLHGFDPDASRQDIHGLLGQMLFSGEEGHKPTAALSGGETARLLFCRIMLQKPNVLILDEPTNHLDLESINALNIALQKFEGTILLVTHDQDLLEEVGTRVWQFENGRIVDFKGSYEEMLVSPA